MQMVKNETQREVITGKVTLEMTPQELATITAAIGRVTRSEMQRSLYVKGEHLVSDKGHTDLYNELNREYAVVFGGKR